MSPRLPLVAIAIGLAACRGPLAGANSQERKGRDPPGASDAYGNGLPKGALARLGSLRWRNRENTLAFSPDGKYLAAAGSVTKLFDACSGQIFRRFEGPSRTLAFSPDSGTLITTSSGYPPVVRCWEVSTGRERRNFQIQAGTNFLLPSSSADSKRLACYNVSYVNPDEKRFVSIWDTETGKQIHKWPDLEAGSIYLSPDGKTFVLPSRNHYFLYDADTGKEKLRIPFPPREAGGNTAETRFLAFTSDGKLMAGLGTGYVYLWDTETGKIFQKLALPKEDAACVAISGNDRTLVAGGRKGSIYLWDLASRKLLHSIHPPNGRDLPIYILALSPDGKNLASQQHLCSWIRVWDVASGRERTDFDETVAAVQCVAFGRDGKSVISLPAGGPICHWDLATGKLRRKIPVKDFQEVAVSFRGSLNNRNGLIDDPVCSVDGKTVLRTLHSGDNLEIGVWQVGEQEPTSSFNVRKLRLRELVLSLDARFVAGLGSDDQDSLLVVWDLARRQELRRFRVPAQTSIGAAFSADGRTLITNHSLVGRQTKFTFSFWELTTGKQRGSLDYELGAIPTLHSVLFHDRLAALSARGTISVIDLFTGKQLERFQGHDDYVSCLAFSEDGRYLASGSTDSTVLIWDLAPAKAEPVNVKLSYKELADHWDELAGTDGAKAYQAIRHLITAGDQAVTFLSQCLPPASQVPKEKIQALIADLDSNTFAKRDQATKELVGLQEAAEAALEEILKGDVSLELRRRVELIFLKHSAARTKPPPLGSGEELQAVRAVEVLEKIGTPEAEALLNRLAKGGSQALRTREAQASLKRLRSRD